jgi:hypothetical protein
MENLTQQMNKLWKLLKKHKRGILFKHLKTNRIHMLVMEEDSYQVDKNKEWLLLEQLLETQKYIFWTKQLRL